MMKQAAMVSDDPKRKTPDPLKMLIPIGVDSH